MEFGSKFVYLGNDKEDEEEVTVTKADEVALSESDSEDDDGETCLLDILDTAGQEEFSSLRDTYVRTGDGFVIIYSITDKESFTEAESIFNWLKRVKSDGDIHAILVANKQDLSSEAVVSAADGQSLASKLGIPFFETSAKTGAGVKEAMAGLVKIIPRASTDYKIVMLGAGAVGKSCISIRFVNDSFVDDYDPTIEDSYRKMIKVQGLPSVSKDERKALKSKRKNKGRQGRENDKPFMASVQRSKKKFRAGSARHGGGFIGSMYQSLRSVFRPASAQPAGDYSLSTSPPPPPPPAPEVKKIKQKKIDGNVVLISLRTLADEPQLVTGDAIKCGGCAAVLTSTARLETQGSTKIWRCEFCGHENKDLDISENEIPKGECLDYMLSPPTKPKEETDNAGAGAAEEKKKEPSAGVIVYCMDISSSMQACCSIPESHAAWRQERTHGTESISRVTRLDCIKKAVQRLAEQLKLEEPTKQVLLTVFSSEFYVKGGGSTENLTCHNALDNKTFDELIQMGLTLSHQYPLKPIEESYEAIDAAVRALMTTGCTALGPALSISMGYVSKIPGSEIVLCTDGEPNVGVGSLSGHGENGAEFYRMIGNYARSKDVTINILAVEGDSVGLQSVSAAAENSGGTTNKLNPMEIVRQLRLIAQNEMVAMSVTVKFYLDPQFVFDEPEYGDNLSQLEKEVGSVRKETDLTFRFKVKDPSKGRVTQSIPFQVQITYTRTDGMRCLRVLSKANQATTNRKDMEENINVSVLGVSAMKTTAKLAQAGKGKEAQHMLKNMQRMVKRGARSEVQMEERLAFTNEVGRWDQELSERNKLYEGGSLDDQGANMIQMACASNVMRQAAPRKKSDLVLARKMMPSTKAAYYAYKDNF